MVGRLHLDVAGLGRDHVGQLAVAGEFQNVGAEFFADPETVSDRLNGFDVEIRTRQVTLARAFQNDGEGRFHVGIGKEDGFKRVDLAGVPIELQMVEHQHGVAGIELGTETVVGKAPEAAVRHRPDAGKALHRLAVERHGKAGQAHAVLAGHGAEALGALAVGGGEFGGGLEVLRRIGRCGDHGVGRQNGVRDQLCRKFLFRRMCRAGERENRERCKKNVLHDGDPSQYLLKTRLTR